MGAQQTDHTLEIVGGGASHADERVETDTVEPFAGETRAYLAEPAPAPSLWLETFPAFLLAMLGLAWIAAHGWLLATTDGMAADPAALLGWIGQASAPLALIGISYLLLRRTSRREGRRFARTARAMAAQADYLERVMGDFSSHVAEHHALLKAQGDLLAQQSESIATRIGEAGGAVREDVRMLATSSIELSTAAATARNDMGALIEALPRAQEHTREMTALLNDASRSAQSQAVTLAGQLAALADHGRDADRTVTIATTALAQHLERIELAASASETRMRDAGGDMARAIETALDHANRSMDETRKGIDAQGAAMMAMVEHARSALERAGSDSARSLGNRLDELGGKIESLASRIAAQDAASHSLIGNLGKALAGVEQRFAALGDTGVERTADLAEAIVALSTHVDELRAAMVGSGGEADALLHRASLLRGAIDTAIRDLTETLPAALREAEGGAQRGNAQLAALLPEAEKVAAAARETVAAFDQGDERIARQRESIDRLTATAEQRVAAIRDKAETLHALIVQSEEDSRRLTEQSGPRLTEALLRVQEAASQAADGARQTLETIIPEAADALARASGDAVDRALAGRIERQMADVTESARNAVQAVGQASERLERQMMTIMGTSAAVEDRIADAKTEAEERDEANFTRRVALLIESLNSAAIDVTKILSNDVTDAAWAAYLRGDRGVFTRRAVRLLSSGEARQIARHYEQEPEFHEHVNRYIHDFEAMLRRVLAGRESGPLSVTLLSSDMGKLYVALAQAIERLRK